MVRVWDIGVRLSHWALVLAVLAAAVTGFVLGPTTLAWHLAAGVTALAIVAWRSIWGILGSTYARFSSFLYRPAEIGAHVRSLAGGVHRRHIGHNPLGALMVFGFLCIVCAIALCGTVALGGMLKQGPLRSFLSYDFGVQSLRVHKFLAIVLLGMVACHLLGVVFESWRGSENLVAAMVTGNKPMDAASDVAAPASARLRLALLSTACLAAIAAGAVVALTARPAWRVPPESTDPVFAEQCSACHLAFPASLAPVSTWNAILADLQHHFTADATLVPEQIAEIRIWLDANSAEHWDTLPSHLLRAPAPDGSLRITDTPGWRRRHRDIAATTFAAGPIYRRSNCAACHADAATGLFAPQNIAIPAATTAARPN